MPGGGNVGVGCKIILTAGVGFVVGCIFAGCNALPPSLSAWYSTRREFPLPHHFPKYPEGISLRFAMVHDVLHERYARHGKPYYTERNRSVRQELATPKTPAQAYASKSKPEFALRDDLGAGLDFLGQHDEAIAVLRDKLTRQQRLGKTGRDLYTSYANLGTFLIHGNFRKATDGDAAARERLREGLSFIRKAIDVNPEAHFGREIWQAVAVEFALAGMNNPEVLLKFDLGGDRLDAPIDPREKRSLESAPAWPHFAAVLEQDARDRGLQPQEQGRQARLSITKVGAEEGWQDLHTSLSEPVAFDEPCLGIVGMWRLGGGANPHFALALGEIMLRVGQRYIAWCAFARACLLSERFSRLPRIREEFVKHCRNRQELIERKLPEKDRQALQPRFAAELKYGQDYQQAYDRYEAERIAAGLSIDDPHFYDDFHAQHGAIASPSGEADRFVSEGDRLRMPLPAGMLFAGVFALAAAVVIRLTRR